jgi:phage terminase large subunit
MLQQLLDVKSESIELKAAPNDSFVSFKTSRAETPEALAGVHSENVLVIGDEASGIPDAVFEAASGSMSGHNAVTILTGNPVRTQGFFFDIFNSEKVGAKWVRLHVSCEKHPNVDQGWVEEMRERYGDRSNVYRVRVMGEFPLADSNTIIPRELIEAAMARDVKPLATAVVVWGLDVAEMGDDFCALCKRKGNVLLEPTTTRTGLEAMEVVGWVQDEWKRTPDAERPMEINVDAIGYGSGVASRLRELGLPARSINVAETPALKDTYRNVRTELWFRGAEWFRARDCNLCGDAELGEELRTQTYEPPTNGKFLATPKKEMKKRYKVRSPNRADAFLLTLASDHLVALGGGRGRATPKRKIKGIV